MRATLRPVTSAVAGHRLDGWSNQDLDVGAIVNLSPDLTRVASLPGNPEQSVRQVRERTSTLGSDHPKLAPLHLYQLALRAPPAPTPTERYRTTR